jgi:hypothetical protein
MIEGYQTKDMKAEKSKTKTSIEEALKRAVEQSDSTKVVEGEGSEPSQELSARVKILMARKTNQQRKKRRVLPKAIR